MMRRIHADLADRITYWDVEDVEWEQPEVATERIYQATVALFDQI